MLKYIVKIDFLKGDIMKKIISLLLIFIMGLGLSACDYTSDGPSVLEQINEAMIALELDSEVDSDITFPSTGLNEVILRWESSNTNVISNDGTVTIPSYYEGDKTVTITAYISLGEDTMFKTFDVLVLSYTELTDAQKLEALKNTLSINTNISSDVALPTSHEEASIVWSSSNTSYITNYGIITRPDNGDGNFDLTLTATLTVGNEVTQKTFFITILEEDPDDFIDVYYINDFHGSILPANDQIGMSYIANFLVTKKEENPDNVIILAGGDILQGSALSNYYNGLSIINMMNEMYFDAFTLGNHEFDWGLEVVTNYFDGNAENGEASFPLLGANVFIEGTTVNPNGIQPYTIIELNNLKIGVIGTMGYGLERSIATSKIGGYYFAEPLPIIQEYAYHLRTVENVDFVFVLSHDRGDINNRVSTLTGDYKVDAIFNAHSHYNYTFTDLGLPVIQSGSNGEYVGHIRFTIVDGIISKVTVENLDIYDSTLFDSPNKDVQDLIDTYSLETDALFNTPIIVSDEDLSQGVLTFWIAKLMRITTNSDIAFHNVGGTRTDIEDGEMINLGLLYQIWPFDNFIKTTWLTGAQINAFKAGVGDFYDTEIEFFDDETYYKVATNDYMFDKVNYPFVNGQYTVNTGLLLRNIAVAELELQYVLYTTFLQSNEILSSSIVPIEDTPVFNAQD